MALCLVVLIGVAGPLAAFDPLSASALPEAAPTRKAQSLVNRAIDMAVRSAVQNAAPARLTSGDDRANDNSSESPADRLIEMRAVGVTSDYIAAMRQAFPRATLDDLTGARAVGVTPEFAQAMRRVERLQ